MSTELRKTGIGVVGDVPWGTHFFFFYETSADLVETLVPYFKAGLEDNELCIWVVSEPLSQTEVKETLRGAIPDADRYLDQGSIEIVAGREWYLTRDELDLKRVTQGWNDRLERALTRGYSGLRLSASTAWLDKKDWREFNEYERQINESITAQPMMALCTYPLAGSGAAEILDVTHSHQFAIARRSGRWEMVETSELKQAKNEIKRLNDELEQRVIERTRQLTAVNEELRREIIERQRAEEALHKAQAELAHVSRLTTLGELTASISHEVNQPIAAVVTNGQVCLRLLALESPRPDDVRTTVERIVRDANRASEVIQRIRALAKRSAPQMLSLDINDVIREAILLVRREVLSHGVSLRTELSPTLPQVMGDRVQLQQVAINLLMNGIEAMAPITDRPREIVIRSQQHEGGEVLVAVTDSGIGLDAETAEQVFNPFFTTKPSGMGMGLSICRSIIRAHGGRLWPSPNPGCGAAFQFTVPVNA